MLVDGRQITPIWYNSDTDTVQVIDQRKLPHEMVIEDLNDLDKTIFAIKDMFVRGAPLIGATGAWGVYIIVRNLGENARDDTVLLKECDLLKNARPTAVNLAWAVDRCLEKILPLKTAQERLLAARQEAHDIQAFEADNCSRIGDHGMELVRKISREKNGETVNILTHCNAGWLACIEWGTATAPMYKAFDAGVDIHVWVDETRPLNQGARLTAWELGKHGIKHTVITDNAGGHLMQHGMVDMVIVGTDRTTHTGDVANKIGTYLKALAARDNNIPFYVALPSSTFDWTLKDGIAQIPIELRDQDEIKYVQGQYDNKIVDVLITPEDSPGGNYAFDVTPARLVTGFITERGICDANEQAIMALFPEKA